MPEYELEHLTVYAHGLQPVKRVYPESYRVIDGDTIAVGPEHWRLYGWDAPPLKGSRDAPCCPEVAELGERAKDYFEKLILWGVSQGTLHIRVRALQDGHGRRLFDMTIDGVDVGAYMKEHGLAEQFALGQPKPRFCECDLGNRMEQNRASDKDLRKERSQAMSPGRARR